MTATETSALTEPYRRELVGYCYRFFGSYPEAEDAVQETMMRAWRRAETFTGASSVRTWLYRIATNICLDMKRAPQRRALPVDLSGPGTVPDGPPHLPTAPPEAWIGPISDTHLAEHADDPAERAALRDSVRLAFLAALQLLPPRQRVLLLLRDVLAWSAQDCADLLDMTVPAVNSALARARRTVRVHDAGPPPRAPDNAEATLLRQYVEAFEAYDIDRLVALLADDAAFSMPPYRFWIRGAAQIERWWRGPGQVCRNSRTVPTRANDITAVGVYHPVSVGRWEPFAVHVVEMIDGQISALTHFMGPAVFAELGLPDIVEDSSVGTDQF
ncbi:sigma-70 family RNA polymerase sigma factor [soil metagenome]